MRAHLPPGVGGVGGVGGPGGAGGVGVGGGPGGVGGGAPLLNTASNISETPLETRCAGESDLLKNTSEKHPRKHLPVNHPRKSHCVGDRAYQKVVSFAAVHFAAVRFLWSLSTGHRSDLSNRSCILIFEILILLIRSDLFLQDLVSFFSVVALILMMNDSNERIRNVGSTANCNRNAIFYWKSHFSGVFSRSFLHFQ